MKYIDGLITEADKKALSRALKEAMHIQKGEQLMNIQDEPNAFIDAVGDASVMNLANGEVIVRKPKGLANQLGKVRILRDVIRNPTTEILEVFANIVPVHIDESFTEDCYVYTAYSPLFEPLPEGSEVPEYTLFLKRDRNMKLTVYAKRRNS